MLGFVKWHRSFIYNSLAVRPCEIKNKTVVYLPQQKAIR
jgi:hypothetical protein